MHAGNHMGIMTTFKKPTAERPAPPSTVLGASPLDETHRHLCTRVSTQSWHIVSRFCYPTQRVQAPMRLWMLRLYVFC